MHEESILLSSSHWRTDDITIPKLFSCWLVPYFFLFSSNAVLKSCGFRSIIDDDLFSSCFVFIKRKGKYLSTKRSVASSLVKQKASVFFFLFRMASDVPGVVYLGGSGITFSGSISLSPVCIDDKKKDGVRKEVVVLCGRSVNNAPKSRANFPWKHEAILETHFPSLFLPVAVALHTMDCRIGLQ